MKINSVMVVDDSEEDHFLNNFVLRNYNPEIEIFQAYDGEEAIEMLKNMTEPPEIIFLDINMPRMNGFEFLEAYHVEGHKQPVVIMLTTSLDEDDRRRASNYQLVVDFLNKPLEVKDIEVFEKKNARRTPDKSH